MTHVEFPKATAQSFVGRGEELDVLLAAFTAAGEGYGGAVFVAGEPGIGKTRLVEEFTVRARRGGACVNWATCREDGGGPAFWPWVQVIRSCIEQGCSCELDSSLVSRVADAQRLVETDEPLDELGGDQARFRLFDSMTTLLTHSCTASPMVVVVDDVHWADVPSVEFLRFFVPELRGVRLLLVSTYRDADVDPASDVGRLLWDAMRTSPRLQIAGLCRDEVGALLSSTAGETASDELIDTVFTRSRGNPLFVAEFGRLLRTHTAIAPAELSVPEGIRAVMHDRLRRLSQPCRDLLAMAAVLGAHFNVEVLAQSVGREQQEVLELLDEATRVRVTLPEDTRSAVFRFSHALMRDAIYEDLPSARRIELHERAADALEVLGATDDERIADLATHALRAADGTRAVWACERAGHQALTQLAYERAASYFRTALQSLATSGRDAAPRTALLIALGEALMGAGDVEAARTSFAEAAQLARTRGEPEDLSRAALGFAAGLGGFEVRMFDAAQITLLEEALAELPDEDSAVRAALLARLSVAVSFLQSEERRRELSGAAVAMARRVDDHHVLAHALAAQCDAIAAADFVDDRIAAASEAVHLSLRAGDSAQELLARRLLLVALMERGDLTAAWREADAFSQTAEQLRQPVYSVYVPVWRGARALVGGRLDDCLAYADEAEAIGARADSTNARIQAWVARIMVNAHRKDFDAVDALWRPLVESLPDLGPSPTLVGRIIAALARDTSVPRPTPAELRALPRDGQWLGAMCWLALGAAELDDAELAVPIYDELLAYESLFGIQGIGAGCHGSIAHWLGRLAAVADRPEAAARHLELAAQVHRRNGMPLLLAHSLAALAELDDDDDRLAEAADLYRGVGLDHLAAAPSSRAGDRVGPLAVFRRDGELWTLTYAGRTVALRDSKGLRDISWLLGQPETEIHVTEIVAATEGAAPLRRDHLANRPAPAEPVLDERAKAAYRSRVTDLQTDIDEAEAAHDIERAARAREELDLLLAELAATAGLGGRSRPMTDDVERARKAVTWRIRDALRRIALVHPELGAHLQDSISTGTFCSYRPRATHSSPR
ncbi:MAG: AAA family ATPase [Acidimicrobiia bacterium]